MKIILLIFGLLIFSKICLGQKNVFFEKSPRKYEPKTLFVELNKGPLIANDFKLIYKYGDSGEYLLSFGCNEVSFTNIEYYSDTIFFLTPSKSKLPLFILREGCNDTITIEEFGAIHNHKVVLEKIYFFDKIKDTVYCYNLWYERPSQFHSSEEDHYFFFKSIAISKRFGFIWVKFDYYNKEFLLNYY